MAANALHFASTLAASRERVWDSIHTMQGVNNELAPWLRMTAPAAHAKTPLEEAPTNTLLFQSWILFRGVLPIDRHAFTLSQVEAGQGFVESSSSWSERTWVHKRTLTPHGQGCRIEDTLLFEPRIAATAPFLRALVRLVFRHRHERLRSLFGEAQGDSG